MKRRTLLAGGAVALGGAGGVYALDSDPGTSGLDRAAAEAAIRKTINEVRYSQSIPALGGDDILREVARDHSADMAARDFFGHRNPDDETPSDRAGCAAGETLYRADLGEVRSSVDDEIRNTRDADELAELVGLSWEHSRSHFQILTDEQYQNVGIGVHVGAAELFVTAVFC